MRRTRTVKLVLFFFNLVLAYTIFLVVTLDMQLAFAGLMFHYADSMLNVIGDEMHTIFNNSAVRDDEHESTATKFYTIQQELQCCGMSGVADYDITGSVNLPDSCCAQTSGNATCTSFNAYNVGCTALTTGAIYFEWNKKMANVVTSVVCVLGALYVLLFLLFMDVYKGGEVRNPPLELSEHLPRHGSTIKEYERTRTPYFPREENMKSKNVLIKYSGTCRIKSQFIIAKSRGIKLLIECNTGTREKENTSQ